MYGVERTWEMLANDKEQTTRKDTFISQPREKLMLRREGAGKCQPSTSLGATRRWVGAP